MPGFNWLCTALPLLLGTSFKVPQGGIPPGAWVRQFPTVPSRLGMDWTNVEDIDTRLRLVP
jgi:hypothetical protein